VVFFSASLAPVKVKTISRFMMTEAVGASLLAGYDFFSFSSIGQFLAQCISLKNTQGSAVFLEMMLLLLYFAVCCRFFLFNSDVLIEESACC
jgi:hypothetical protein